MKNGGRDHGWRDCRFSVVTSDRRAIGRGWSPFAITPAVARRAAGANRKANNRQSSTAPSTPTRAAAPTRPRPIVNRTCASFPKPRWNHEIRGIQDPKISRLKNRSVRTHSKGGGDPSRRGWSQGTRADGDFRVEKHQSANQRRGTLHPHSRAPRHQSHRQAEKVKAYGLTFSGKTLFAEISH